MAQKANTIGTYAGKMATLQLIESFRSPFTLNGNDEKRHLVSRDTLNGQRLRWIFYVSNVQNHLLPYEISVEFFRLPKDSIQCFVSVNI